MNWLLLITQGTLVAGTLLTNSAEFAARWKALHELDPDVKVNVINLTNQAIALDDATIAQADAWLASKKIKP